MFKSTWADNKMAVDAMIVFFHFPQKSNNGERISKYAMGTRIWKAAYSEFPLRYISSKFVKKESMSY
jgi:hypothetical protein